MRNILLHMISCLFICHTLQAQYSFSGKVIDEQKKVLPGAQVLLSVADSLHAAAMTDRNGKFALKNLADGEYDLHIEFPGYTPLEERRTINSDQHFEFMLAPEMNVKLENVDVVANNNDRVEKTATGQIFRLSEKAKQSGDPYLALREIPRLVSNNALKDIKMDDGSSPLILIDGIAINTGISPIDPKDIESVEVIDVVGARYLRTGAKHILNIKLKEKRSAYRFFEAMTRHDMPVRQGMNAIYFEVGNHRYSLYGRAAFGYIHYDDSELELWQQGLHYRKQSLSNSRANNRDALGELLFKWKMTQRDYLAIHLYATHKRETSREQGTGTYDLGSRATVPFTLLANDLDKSNVLTASLYERHDFGNKMLLETTLAFNKNWNRNEGNRTENYADRLYNDLYLYNNRRTSSTLNVDYSWQISDTKSFNAGSETRFLNDKIREITSGYPLFHHREWSEYLYASFSGMVGKSSYMLSAGGEAFRIQAGDRTTSYVKPRASASVNYDFSKHHALRLNYILTNQAPSVGQLNPYNTSTDSLVRTVGNPELRPMQQHDIRLAYTFNYKGLYVTPSVNYSRFRDVIEPFGYTEQEIYTSTYRNQGKYQWLVAGGNISKRLGTWGQAYLYNSYNTLYFERQPARNFIYLGGGMSASYKKWYFNADVAYRNRAYTAVSYTNYRMPTFSMAQVTYHFTPGFYISVAMQYLAPPLRFERFTDGSADYQSRQISRMKDLSWRPWILLRYTFRKNVKRKISLGNVVRGREKGIELKTK